MTAALEYRITRGRDVRRVGDIGAARREALNLARIGGQFSEQYAAVMSYTGGTLHAGDVTITHAPPLSYIDQPRPRRAQQGSFDGIPQGALL